MTTIKTENWDEGDPGSWPTCGGAAWRGWLPKDYDCNAQGYQSGLVTSKYNSAPRSLKVVRDIGEGDVLDLSYSFSAVTKLHLRMYVYFDSSWENAHYGSNEELIHFVFFNTAISGVNFGIEIRNFTDQWPFDPNNYCPSGGDNGGIHFGFHSYYNTPGGTPKESVYGPAGNPPPLGCWNIKDHLNEWHCYEWMWDLGTSTVKMWIDGNLKIDRTMYASNHTSISKIIVSGWNSCSSCRNHYEATWYLDDIVLADEYIGPISSGGVTVYPGVIGLTGSQPSPETKYGYVNAGPVSNMTASVLRASVQEEAIVTPSPQGVSANLPSPAVIEGQGVTITPQPLETPLMAIVGDVGGEPPQASQAGKVPQHIGLQPLGIKRVIT